MTAQLVSKYTLKVFIIEHTFLLWDCQLTNTKRTLWAQALCLIQSMGSVLVMLLDCKETLKKMGLIILRQWPRLACIRYQDSSQDGPLPISPMGPRFSHSLSRPLGLFVCLLPFSTDRLPCLLTASVLWQLWHACNMRLPWPNLISWHSSFSNPTDNQFCLSTFPNLNSQD